MLNPEQAVNLEPDRGGEAKQTHGYERRAGRSSEQMPQITHSLLEVHMAHFITVQEGSVTLNVDLIATVDWWSSGAATVTMMTGVEIECEGESYALLREAMGLDLPDLELVS